MLRIMNSILYGCLACLAATPFVLARSAESGTVPLDVEFKLTDREYRPLAGVLLRLALGIEDWQAADAGVRIVTVRGAGYVLRESAAPAAPTLMNFQFSLAAKTRGSGRVCR